MNKTLLNSALLAASVLVSSTAFANTEQDNKHWQVGVGSYAVVVEADDYPDDDFTGFNLSSTYAFTDNVAIRGQYYSLEHDDESDLELSGVDILRFTALVYCLKALKLTWVVGFTVKLWKWLALTKIFLVRKLMVVSGTTEMPFLWNYQ